MNDTIQVMLSNMCCGAGVCGTGLGASQPRDKLRLGEEITVLVG